MVANPPPLVGALPTLVLLSAVVGLRLLFTRMHEVRHKRVHAQAASTSVKIAARPETVQAADTA